MQCDVIFCRIKSRTECLITMKQTLNIRNIRPKIDLLILLVIKKSSDERDLLK